LPTSMPTARTAGPARAGTVLLMAAVLAGPAFAQAGSTGGTLGKTDQSLSGGSPKRAPAEKAAAPAVARQKIFVNPTIKGIPVDRCWHFGMECDEPAASAWCRSKGLKRATDWQWQYSNNTIGQSDGRQCPMPGQCGGFTKIVCE
jgi:hypothetical protein